jgi:hypothetical protein
MPQHTAVFIREHFVKLQPLECLPHALNDAILMPGITLPLNQRLAQGNN